MEERERWTDRNSDCQQDLSLFGEKNMIFVVGGQF
jgi:hypothetical protein